MSFEERINELLGEQQEEEVNQFYNNYNHNRLKNLFLMIY